MNIVLVMNQENPVSFGFANRKGSHEEYCSCDDLSIAISFFLTKSMTQIIENVMKVDKYCWENVD